MFILQLNFRSRTNRDISHLIKVSIFVHLAQKVEFGNSWHVRPPSFRSCPIFHPSLSTSVPEKGCQPGRIFSFFFFSPPDWINLIPSMDTIHCVGHSFNVFRRYLGFCKLPLYSRRQLGCITCIVPISWGRNTETWKKASFPWSCFTRCRRCSFLAVRQVRFWFIFLHTGGKVKMC